MRKIILTTFLFLFILVLCLTAKDFQRMLTHIGQRAQLISARQQLDASTCIQAFTQNTDLKFIQKQINLNTDNKPDLALIHTEGTSCGTAGCVTELCLQEENGKFRHIRFGYVAEDLTTKPNVVNGMHDVETVETIFTWNGERYIPEQ
jgi:hypothetical protein